MIQERRPLTEHEKRQRLLRTSFWLVEAEVAAQEELTRIQAERRRARLAIYEFDKAHGR